MHELIEAFAKLGSAVPPESTAMLRALGYPMPEKLANPVKRPPRNHGPRPQSTFDHQGRRRY